LYAQAQHEAAQLWGAFPAKDVARERGDPLRQIPVFEEVTNEM
jgi:hypothetical protein